MNFARSVREEICRKPIKDACCKKAFIAGVIRGSGELYFDDGLCLQFTLKSEQSAMLVSELFFSVYGYEIREVSVSEDKLNKSDSFVLSLSGEKTEDILTDLNILIKKDGEYAVNLKFYGAITQKPCCLRAFFKGLFLSSGHCTVPAKAGSKNTRYHLEIQFSHSVPAADTSEKLAENGVKTKISRRKGAYLLYLKSGEEMKNFFAFIGAAKAVLKLTELMINGEMTNMVNRRKNCDLGNVARQTEASLKQTEAINKIEEKIGLDALKKEELIVTAKTRRDYPEDTLFELSQKLGITKSCLNHRLRKIVEIAKEIKD